MWLYYITIAFVHSLWQINKNRRFYNDPDSVSADKSRVYHFIFYTLRLGYIPVFWNELSLTEILLIVFVTEIGRLIIVGVATGYFMKKSLDNDDD